MAPGEHTDAGPPAPSGSAKRALWSGLDQASIMSVELIAAILTWMGIGWLVDQWLGTMPWFMAGGALLGNAAGLYLIWVRSGRVQDRDASSSSEPGPAGPVADGSGEREREGR